MTITNDNEFKRALQVLSFAQQRMLAARFAESVLSVSKDTRVVGAIQAAKRAGIDDRELAPIFHAARAAMVESYTQCGKEADWMCQAGHFVAKAAMSSVMPEGKGGNPAWESAMNARMARAAETVARGDGTGGNREAERQYHILDEFLARKD